MSEFMGDDHSVALQRSILARAREIAANPLLANGGRILNILDPELYGWNNVRKDAERDGFVGLTMVDRARTFSKLGEVFGEGETIPCWECFTGTPEDVLPVCAKIISAIALPDDWTVSGQTHPDDRSIHDVQELNKLTGVAPTPAYFLRGAFVPSMLTCIRDKNGDLAASASGTMRYHPDGPLGGWFLPARCLSARITAAGDLGRWSTRCFWNKVTRPIRGSPFWNKPGRTTPRRWE